MNTRFRLPLSVGDETYCGAVLVAVYDKEGRLIYSQDLPDGIGEITDSDDGYVEPAHRIFDLQGRELRAPAPGQPYIRGGKVRI